MQERRVMSEDDSVIEAGAVIYNTETKMTGIVAKVQREPQCLYVSVSLGADGKLVQTELTMLPDDCRHATVEERRALQQALNKEHFVWDAHKRRIVEDSLELADGTYVRVSTLGENMIFGVFKGLDDKGNIILYCWADKNRNIGCSLNEVIGPKEYHQIQVIGSHARYMLNVALAKNGVQWNNRRKCLEHIVRTADSDDGIPVYYYIDDFLEVHKVQDTHKTKDHKRIMVGNYFATQEEAEEVRDCFRSILRIKSRAASPGVRKKRK